MCDLIVLTEKLPFCRRFMHVFDDLIKIAHDEESNCVICYVHDDEEDKAAAKLLMTDIQLPYIRYHGKIYQGREAWRWASKMSNVLYDVDDEDITKYHHTKEEISFYMWLKN